MSDFNYQYGESDLVAYEIDLDPVTVTASRIEKDDDCGCGCGGSCGGKRKYLRMAVAAVLVGLAGYAIWYFFIKK